MQRCSRVYLYTSLLVVQVAGVFLLCIQMSLLILCALQYFGVLSTSIQIGRQGTCIIAAPRNWGMQHCHCKICYVSCTFMKQGEVLDFSWAGERGMVNFIWLRAVVTRKLNHKTPACIDQVPKRDYLHENNTWSMFLPILCLLNHLLCSFLTTHLLFSSSNIRITKMNM